MSLRLTIYAHSTQMAVIESHVCSRDDNDYDVAFHTHNENEIIIECEGTQKIFPSPVRLGAILDYINNDCMLTQMDQNRSIPIGRFHLEVNHRTLKCPEHNDIVLTEKEVAILFALYEQDNYTLSRDALLKTVWGYVDGIETHTLETHIYRLRQKIEDDPKDPKILITDQNFYRLNRS